MPQDIYFPSRPSLERITGVYTASSVLLLCGIVIFGLIFVVALVSLCKIGIKLSKARYEQRHLYVDMEIFYKKQLKLLHGKPFFHSLYQYITLLMQLGKGKDVHSLFQMFGYDDDMIRYIEKVHTGEIAVDYEQEKRIKEILHKHIS